MTEHTPGPWWVEDAPYKHIRSASGCVWADDYKPNANASLIAAAPELLRELTHLVNLLQSLEHDGRLETLNGARAAIAKATASTENSHAE